MWFGLKKEAKLFCGKECERRYKNAKRRGFELPKVRNEEGKLVNWELWHLENKRCLSLRCRKELG